MSGEPITAAGLEALEAELAELEGPRMQDLARKINSARAEGDLSENAEYHALKEEQGLVHSKILRLQERLRNAVVVEAQAAGDVVAFGVPFEVTLPNGQTKLWTIVGATEADIAAGRVSAESPVAKALLGAAVGATVEVAAPRGTQTYAVVRVVG
jgi:transcription elongation factor GreA